jgi:hypothetical protein
MIDLNVVTSEALGKLNALDATFVGTPNYMGVTYFWGQGPKHYLREASQAQRRRVHKKWLEQGLDLYGDTNDHFRVIGEVMPRYRQEIQNTLKVNGFEAHRVPKANSWTFGNKPISTAEANQ